MNQDDEKKSEKFSEAANKEENSDILYREVAWKMYNYGIKTSMRKG